MANWCLLLFQLWAGVSSLTESPCSLFHQEIVESLICTALLSFSGGGVGLIQQFDRFSL